MRSDLTRIIDMEMRQADMIYGPFNSPHELYGVFKEEFDEYWDSIRADDEDLYELVQAIGVGIRYINDKLASDPMLIAKIEARQEERWGFSE